MSKPIFCHTQTVVAQQEYPCVWLEHSLFHKHNTSRTAKAPARTGICIIFTPSIATHRPEQNVDPDQMPQNVGVSSGSTRFVNHPGFSDTSTGAQMDLFKC